MKTVTVIIPTLNAEEQVSNLLNSLKQKSFPPGEIIVIDSESSDKTLELAKNQGAKVISINRKDFDHGGSRNLAAQKAEGEYILFLVFSGLNTNSPSWFVDKSQELPFPKWSVNDLYF